MDGIVVNPQIHFGKSCIAGTRIPVQSILKLLNEGHSFGDIIRDYYSDIQPDDIRACRIWLTGTSNSLIKTTQ
jgi:uncharacterized protein (DUF433 family)